MDFIKIVLEFIGVLTILKYALLEAKDVIAAGGNFICSIKKAVNKVKNSK